MHVHICSMARIYPLDFVCTWIFILSGFLLTSFFPATTLLLLMFDGSLRPSSTTSPNCLAGTSVCWWNWPGWPAGSAGRIWLGWPARSAGWWNWAGWLEDDWKWRELSPVTSADRWNLLGWPTGWSSCCVGTGWLLVAVLFELISSSASSERINLV